MGTPFETSGTPYHTIHIAHIISTSHKIQLDSQRECIHHCKKTISKYHDYSLALNDNSVVNDLLLLNLKLFRILLGALISKVKHEYKRATEHDPCTVIGTKE